MSPASTPLENCIVSVLWVINISLRVIAVIRLHTGFYADYFYCATCYSRREGDNRNRSLCYYLRARYRRKHAIAHVHKYDGDSTRCLDKNGWCNFPLLFMYNVKELSDQTVFHFILVLTILIKWKFWRQNFQWNMWKAVIKQNVVKAIFPWDFLNLTRAMQFLRCVNHWMNDLATIANDDKGLHMCLNK